jgi:predicted nucleic acid-binding protein
VPDEVAALDTDAFSSWFRGEVDLARHFLDRSPALPVTVVEETCYGWILATPKAEQRGREDLIALYLDRLADLVEFSRGVLVLRYTPEAQAFYRSLRVGRGDRGRNDLRIAATCLAHQVPLLSRNRDHFADIEGLRLLSP